MNLHCCGHSVSTHHKDSGGLLRCVLCDVVVSDSAIPDCDPFRIMRARSHLALQISSDALKRIRAEWGQDLRAIAAAARDSE